MTEPKFYFLPANLSPKRRLPEEPKRPIQKARLWDANGLEFVNLDEVIFEAEPLPLGEAIVTVRMRLMRGEIVKLDAPLNHGYRDRMIRELAEMIACRLDWIARGSHETIFNVVKSELGCSLPWPADVEGDVEAAP